MAGEAIHNCSILTSKEAVLHELQLQGKNNNLDILNIDSRLLFLSVPIIAPQYKTFQDVNDLSHCTS